MVIGVPPRSSTRRRPTLAVALPSELGDEMSSIDIPSALTYLDGLANYDRTGKVQHPTTERMVRLVEAMGQPQRRYPVIHVTGTNGKGSTTAMAAALLRAEGLRVGTYTSPHLERLGERVNVDGRAVTDEQLAAAIARVADAAERLGLLPSWFEAVTAAGFAILSEESVDVGVIEVGMLGRWDATNVVHGQVAVITNVGLDHIDVAGPTRRHVAYEKAGIIKSGSVLVLGEQDPELRFLFEDACPSRILTRQREIRRDNRIVTDEGSTIDIVTPWGSHVGVPIGLEGPHQCDNALLAVSAAEAFLGRALKTPVAQHALATPPLSGRFEVVARNPDIILDGAHNQDGAAALRLVVAERLKRRRPRILVWGMLGGRDPNDFLAALGPTDFDLIITTEPRVPRAVSAEILARAVELWGVRVLVTPSLDAAIDMAVEVAGQLGAVLIAGSLYLVGNARALCRSVNRS